MTDLANTGLLIAARQTREGVSIGRGHLRTLRTDLDRQLYALAEATVNSGEFQGLRADLEIDLTLLDGIYRRLDRLAVLLERGEQAEFTFAQAKVAESLSNLHQREGRIVTKDQADYFVKHAIEAFKPSYRVERVEVDRTAVEQAIFALVDDPEQRRLRERITVAAVRQAVLAASEVSY